MTTERLGASRERKVSTAPPVASPRRRTKKLTGTAIWAALRLESAFVEQVKPEHRALYKALTQRAATVLSANAGRPLSVRVLLEAKMKLTADLLGSDLLARHIGDAALARSVRRGLERGMVRASAIIADIPGHLRRAGVSEALVMGHILTPDNRALYNATQLSLGHLLVTQPWLVFGTDYGVPVHAPVPRSTSPRRDEVVEAFRRQLFWDRDSADAEVLAKRYRGSRDPVRDYKQDQRRELERDFRWRTGASFSEASRLAERYGRSSSPIDTYEEDRRHDRESESWHKQFIHLGNRRR
ncbi:MAG: hypothetical protein ACAI38_09775 [Myxococcota bacterium]